MLKRSLFLAAVATFVLSGCTSHKTALRALEAQGFTDVELCGSSYWCCAGRSAWFSDCFSAKGPTGVPVDGCICRGLFGGSTVKIK